MANEFEEIKRKLQKYFSENGVCKLIVNKTKKPLTLDEKISNVLHNHINEIALCDNIIQQTKEPPPQENFHIPLQFWFNRDPGVALPTIALPYHEIKINIDLSNREDLQQFAEN